MNELNNNFISYNDLLPNTKMERLEYHIKTKKNN